MVTPTVLTAQAQTNDSAIAKASNLLSNVVPIDLTGYSISGPAYSKVSTAPGYNVTEETVNYNLTKNGKTATVTLTFQDSRLFTLLATAPANILLTYNQPTVNVLAMAKSTMEHYQAFLSDNTLNAMTNLLATVGSLQNQTLVSSNIKLEISVTANETSFTWKHVIGGCEYDEVTLAFTAQTFTLGDMQSRYKMGDTNIKVSKSQAIDTALEYARNYSYQSCDENGTMILVGGFNVSRQTTTAELCPQEKDGLLYPSWKVTVPLSQVYPGRPTAFVVSVWAGSGEVSAIKTVSTGGAFLNDINDYREAANNPQGGNSTPEPNVIQVWVDSGFRVASVVVIIASIIAAALILRRRSTK